MRNINIFLAVFFSLLFFIGLGQTQDFTVSTAASAGSIVVGTSQSATTAQQGFQQFQYTVPSNVCTIRVEVWGAGGGGCGRTGSSYAGAGGGGGAYARKMSFSVTPGQTLYIQVGRGGAAANSGNNTAGAGGTTYVRTTSHTGTIIASAGGGSGGANSSTSATGGSGSTTRTINSTSPTTNDDWWGGGAGGGGTGSAGRGAGGGGGAGSGGTGQAGASCSSGTGTGGVAGAALASPFVGLAGGTGGGCTGTNNGGTAGGVRGAGGGGSGTGSTAAGGAGGDGFVRITWTTTTPSTPSVSIVSSDADNTICSGTSVTFTATPTNGGTPSYQWKLNGTNVGTNSSTYSNSSLATGSTVSVTMTTSLTCVSSSTANSNTITTTVNAAPTISYAGSPYTYTQGTAISNLTPTTTGTSFSVSPSLPSGLSLNASTGVISGTPSGTQVATSYTITATSNGCTATATISIAVRPSNYLCTTATSLPCATSNLSGTTVGTTNVAHGISGTCLYSAGVSNYGVWYTFVGDGNNTTITVTPASGYDIEVDLLSGSCGTFSCVNGGTDSELSGVAETVTFTTVNGTTYFVYVAHYLSGSTTTNTFTISRTCTSPPSNNNCSGAPALSVSSNTSCTTSSNGTTVGANQSIAACTGTADDDVWYSFVATATSQIITVTPGTMSDAVFQVYSGTCSGLTSLDCVDATSGSSAETKTIAGLVVGDTYFVRVHSYGNGTGQGTFSICVTTPCLVTTNPGTLSVSPSSTGTVNDAFTYTTTGNEGTITSLEYSFNNFTSVAGSFTNPVNPFDLILNSYQSQVWVRTNSVNGTCPAGTSNIVSVTLQLAPPYSNGTSSGDYITNVTLSNLNNNSTYDLPLGDSYQDFTALTANVDRGGVYTLSVTATQTGGLFQGYAVWIDYDNDGTFETTENVMLKSPLSLTQTQSITIPSDAYVGVVKMRVLSRRNGTPTIDAYNSIGYNRGEIEEYSVNIQSALPVELLKFKGVKEGSNNYVYWITASEQNTSHFNLQHSRDGENWEVITTLNAAGNSTNLIEYSVTDYGVEPIINYYRLQQYDLDGIYETFGPISIDNTGTIKYLVKRVNMKGEEVPLDRELAPGVYLEIYNDGSIKKVSL